MPKAISKQTVARKIFVSYSHADYRAALKLNTVLKLMCERLGHIPVFLDCKGDERIVAGDPWRKKIREALETSDVFLVLMSNQFLDSDFCRHEELKRMLERCNQDARIRVIGIALHMIRLENFFVQISDERVGLEEYQCIPQDEMDGPTGPRLGLRPINNWDSRKEEDAWTLVANQIEAALPKNERTSVKASSSDARETPSVPANWWPYLCDRDDQYLKLVGRLEIWKATDFRRPLVLVTEGRSEDCLFEWVQRLRHDTISKCLRFDEHGLSFGHFKRFAWPRAAIHLRSADDARGIFVRAFAASLGPTPMATLQMMCESYELRAHPTLLWADCPDADDPAQACLALEGLLAMLRDWPALNFGSMMVVAINVTKPQGSVAQDPAKLGAPFETMIEGFASRSEIQQALMGSLTDVVESDIQEWSQHDRVAALLKDDIGSLLTQLPSSRERRWPMRVFAETARGWLR